MARLQSAIEFLATYSLVLIIIAVVLSVLYLFVALPQTVAPAQCTFYSGFNCLDALYIINSSAGHGSTLMITAVDAQPGIVNITSFSGFLNFVNSYHGYCTPSVLAPGETTYCYALFSTTPKVGNSYQGTINVKGTYCSSTTSQIYTASCPSTGGQAYAYGGGIRVQAAGVSLTPTGYINITVRNTQGITMPGGSQVEIQFVPNTYNAFERSDLGNIRFFQGPKELYSWCEANCNSLSTSNAIFWVKSQGQIPSNSAVAFTMYFEPQTNDYDGIYAGQAPGLSRSYAQFDNGAQVFSFYDNFQGTSLNANNWRKYYAGVAGSVTVNNGVTISTFSTTKAELLAQTTGFNGTEISEANFIYAPTGSPGASGGIMQQNGSSSTANGYIFTADSALSVQSGAANTAELSAGPVLTLGTGVMGIAWAATGNYVAYSNYAPSQGTDSTYPKGTLTYAAIGVFYGTSGTSNSHVKLDWVRNRIYPPNGVAPTITFNTIVQTT
ncbi:MAG: hypothetical protein KGH98_03605 [Candidatus Micrarchaeota archaeon]|nr:hypothetical protein [Candidatus Micrarchaeota archaeon]